MISSVLALSGLLAVVRGQQVGTSTAEVHPPLTVSTCTAAGCTTVTQSIVIDANWRWLHNVGGYTNCYTGNTWNSAICTNGVTCAANCALEGATYSSTYGITTTGNALRLNFVTTSAQTNVGSRTYLMAAGSTTQYQIFKPLNQEFTFDVDVSNLPCGLNGALYFVEMDADGGMAKYPTNLAGAKYGTGYCDAQCPQDIKFINGEANSVGWTPSSNDVNAGAGQYGSCCNEMDIWEANKISTAYTPHPCSVTGQTRCTGTDCGIGARYSSLCDADGCDFNSYRMGNTSFYGPGLTVNTNLPMTVVTQFITNDNTATGTLVEIKRFYVQGGYIIPNSQSTYSTVPGNSITDSFCANQKTAFGDINMFATKGGLAAMGNSLKRGVVLVMSIWDDHTANMLWLDAPYPPTKAASDPGVSRGSCSATSGNPTDVEANSPNAYVVYSNIKWGTIGSTYSGVLLGGGSSGSSSSSSKVSTSTKASSSSSSTKASTATTSTKASTTSTKASSTTLATSTKSSTVSSAAPSSTLAPAARWAQCGGYPGVFNGPYTCESPWVCTYSSPYYSQCL